MSIQVMARIWKSAPYGGGTLLTLLALANYADDRGVCFPTQSTLASDARLTDRHLRNTLHMLVDAGDLLMQAGRGRSRPTIYCILVGLSDTERAEKRKAFPEIISGLGFRFSAKSGNFRHQKAEISDTKKRKFDALKNGSLDDQEASNLDPIRHEIHHEIQHDPPPPTPSAKPMPIGGGGGGSVSESTWEPTETSAWMQEEGFSKKAQQDLRSLNLAAAQADFSRRRALGQGIGAIVTAWRDKPPVARAAEHNPMDGPWAPSDFARVRAMLGIAEDEEEAA